MPNSQALPLYHDTKHRTLGAILAAIKNLISSLTNILYVPLMLYCMSSGEFGVYQLVGSLLAFFINADFGHCATSRMYTIARLHQDIQGQARALGFSLLFYIAISACICVIGYVAYGQLENLFNENLTVTEIDSVKSIFILLLVNISISFPSSIFTSVINSHEKFIFLRSLQIIQSILRPITVIFMLFFFPYAVTVAIIQTVFNIFHSIVRAWYCFTKLTMRISFTNFASLPIKPFVVLASSTLLIFFLEQFLWRSNQIILGISRGVEEVAVYGVASVIYFAYASFSMAIPSVFFSKMTSLVTCSCSNEDLSNIFIRISRVQWIFLLLILLGFAFVGQEFMALWAGPDFSNAYSIALFIMIPFSIELMQSIASVIMQAQNTYSYRVKVYALMGIANLALALPLSYIFGAYGCALATGMVMLLGSGFMMNYYYIKYMGLDIRKFWLEMAKILLVSSPLFPLAFFMNNYWSEYAVMTFMLKVAIIIICYMILQGSFAFFVWKKKA